MTASHDPERTRTVSCPQCKGDSIYSPANAYRPFCGARCKGLDLGAWADEGFRLAVDPGGMDDGYAPAPPLQ